MEKDNKLNPKIILTAIVIIIIIVAVYPFKKDDGSSIKKIFTSVDLSSASQITCTYPQILHTSYLNNEVTHELPKPEKNPLIFTFSKLSDLKVSQLSYIDSTQTITNTPIIKLVDDSEKYIYLEGNGDNYLTTHTIYKKIGVSTYTKSVSLFGIPSGSLAMGTCVDY